MIMYVHIFVFFTCNHISTPWHKHLWYHFAGSLARMRKVVIPILCACCASLMFSIYKFAPIYIDITKATFTPKTTFTVGLNVTNVTRATTDSNSPGWKAIAVSTNDMCGKESRKEGIKCQREGLYLL